MINVGLGKDSEELAYLGCVKCPNCKNHSHFSLYAVTDKLKLYFVSVTKFNTKYFTVCSICSSGYQVDKNKKNKMLVESSRRPDKKTFTVIRDRLDETVSAFKNAGYFPQEDFLEKVGALKKLYPSEHVDYVVHSFINWIFDENASC